MTHERTSQGSEEERVLPVELTEQEIREAGKALARIHEEINGLEIEKAETAKEYNNTIKELTRGADREAHKVNTGTEEQTVQCTWQYYWDENRKVLYRADTGVEVASIAIQDYERQERLDLADPITTPAPPDGKSAATGEGPDDPWEG